MIGDSHNDILSGKAANTKTCLVKYTFLPLEGLLKYEPDYAIDDMRELLNIYLIDNKTGYLKRLSYY